MENYQRTAAQMAEDKREKLVIDLRKEREYGLGTYPGAVNLYWEDLEQKLKTSGLESLELPKDTPIYLLCYTGETSDEYAQYLNSNGYEAYSIVEGYRGYLRWRFSGKGLGDQA